MYRIFVKRMMDFLVSFTILILISPIFLLLIFLLAIANTGNPFFIQKRPGKNERIFSIIKFKTMNDKKDAKGNLLADKYRITKVGKVVRKTSLDELPQLINVVKGDMSFIGPRPLLIQYLDCYYDHEKVRHSIRPGITGLAQVSGRNLLKWDSRLQKDIEYIENLSFSLDLQIILKTIKNVLSSKDIVVDAQSTMLNLCNERKLKKAQN